MKKLLLLAILILKIGILQAQTDKPRFLSRPTLLCPIDITKTNSVNGLFRGNTQTIMIRKDSTVVESSENGTNKKINTKQYRTDTLLLTGIQIEGNYAFNIVKQEGSFSIIKFWDLKSASSNSLIKKLKSNPHKNTEFRKLQSDEDYQEWEVEGLVATVTDDSVAVDLSKSYYILPTAVLLKNSTEFENKANAWNIGILALPVKIRPFATEKGQFDFTNGYSVGTTFSWTVHHNWKANFTHNF